MSIFEIGSAAKSASIQLAAMSSDAKNKALAAIACALKANAAEIFSANKQDLEEAAALPAPVVKRLTFDEKKLSDVLASIQSLISLPDPVGIVQKATLLDDGLELRRISCPIGVIGMVFEARPDALVQIATLCLKSGNAVMLKGGKEARRTNAALASTLIQAVPEPAGWLSNLETREDVKEMLSLSQFIDLIIPRGSNAFVQYIMANTSIPVMGHADGICHVYVDAKADVDMAVKIIVDSKTQYVSVCNATETLLVHKDIAPAFLPRAAEALKARKVRLLGCPIARQYAEMGEASEQDWSTEYLDYVLSVKVVSSIDEAIAHINKYGSAHTDCIVTDDSAAAEHFTSLIKSANAFWNCSTRFSDGFRYGLGAEVGISTGKLHARGPVGLDGLCTYKWLLKGHGDIVADYASGNKTFKHRPLDK